MVAARMLQSVRQLQNFAQQLRDCPVTNVRLPNPINMLKGRSTRTTIIVYPETMSPRKKLKGTLRKESSIGLPCGNVRLPFPINMLRQIHSHNFHSLSRKYMSTRKKLIKGTPRKERSIGTCGGFTGTSPHGVRQSTNPRGGGGGELLFVSDIQVYHACTALEHPRLVSFLTYARHHHR